MSFEKLFHPAGVAIIGASAQLERIGGQPIKALKKAGYKGAIYPVNPKYPELHGFPCYPNAASIEGPCDMAIIAVPAAGVAAAVRDCAKKGIGHVVVLTAGFREAGGEGKRLEADLAQTARETGVRVIGPNCQGMLSVHDKVWAAFGSVSDETDFRPGKVSCAFQSGGFGYAVVNQAEAQGVGFRYCVSSGNETDVAMPELLDAFLDDPGTELAFCYMEGTPDARQLLDVGHKSLTLGKPVLVWKAANTDIGAKAAASHTANMTGSYDLYRACFKQSGLIEVDDVEPIVDIARLVSQGRLPKGNRIGVLSISGGSGIVFADRAVKLGLELPPFSQRTVDGLKAVVPSFGAVDNPADTTANVISDMSLFEKTLDIVLEDPNVDQLSLLMASIGGAAMLRAARAIAAAAAKTDKPVHVQWSGRPAKSPEAAAALEEGNVPFIPTPARLAEAAAVLARFSVDRQKLLARKAPPAARADVARLPDGSGALSEAESKALLAAYDIPVTKEVVVPEGGDTAAAARAMRGPYVVKVVSRDIAHKTEVGGVKLGLATPQAVADAAAEVIANGRKAKPNAKIDGALVAEMASGLEALIGVVNDPNFGPTVALGLGGVLTEILKDVTYRIAPFDIETAREMIGELRGAKLFDGYRGSPVADKEALAKMLVEVSRMAAALKDRVAEVDINPVFVRPKGEGCVAADALVILK